MAIGVRRQDVSPIGQLFTKMLISYLVVDGFVKYARILATR